MYSTQLLELFRSRAHGGSLTGATHRGAAGSPAGQGPRVELSMRVLDGIVLEARWKTFGCPASIACSEALCAWAEGRTLGEVKAVTAAEIEAQVDGVPEEKRHCPELVVAGASALTPVLPGGEPGGSGLSWAAS